MNKFIKAIKLIGNPPKLVIRMNENGLHRLFSDKFLLKMKFKYNLGKKLDIDNPKTFNEKLQWLKLYNRKPEYTRMVDKYEAKKYVAEKIGEEYIIPTLGVWDKIDDIDFDSLPDQFVLKCTHDSGGLVICRDKDKLDIERTKKRIAKSLKKNYYWSSREWPYKNVKPRIIAEQYIGVGDCTKDCEPSNSWKLVQNKHGLLDFKFMCFDGVVKALFLDIGVIGRSEGHANEYYRNVYDRSGNILPVRETRENYPGEIRLPETLPKMVEIAEILSAGIPHLRVDLYCLNSGEIKVGELTFYHGSGMSNVFIPQEWDKIFGGWIKLPENVK